MAIDSRKTVAELAAVTGLEMQDVSKVLRVLLQEHCIQLYDAAGQLVETMFGPAPSQGNEVPSQLVEQGAEPG
jgi:hypothetical protein